MFVTVDVLESSVDPQVKIEHDQVVAMLLRPGAIELGLQRTAISRFAYAASEMILCHRHATYWIRPDDHLHRLTLRISDAALNAACEGSIGEVELRGTAKLVDGRVSALVAAVNEERIAGFPSGRLFLDSVEQALAVALVKGHAVRSFRTPMIRGGLTPARLRRVVELIRANIGNELTLDQLAGEAGLSVAHFSRVFHKSTGESPHQFVLRLRVERAKELLRETEARVLNVSMTCGFKSQQHLAQVFRRFCGVSPTQYQQGFSR